MIFAGYLIWDYIAVRNVIHQQNNVTVWSVLTALLLTFVWVLIPVFQVSIAFRWRRSAAISGYVLLFFSGPVLLCLSAYGSLAGVEPLLNWCPMDSFCWNDNVYPFLELITWDLLFLVSVLCTYLWYRATSTWVSERYARYTYRRIRGQLLDVMERDSIHSDRGSVCAICLDEFHRSQDLRRLPRCRHHFHAACIDRWFETNLICPICRQEVIHNE